MLSPLVQPGVSFIIHSWCWLLLSLWPSIALGPLTWISQLLISNMNMSCSQPRYHSMVPPPKALKLSNFNSTPIRNVLCPSQDVYKFWEGLWSHRITDSCSPTILNLRFFCPLFQGYSVLLLTRCSLKLPNFTRVPPSHRSACIL